MKFFKKYAGIALISTGVLLLAALHFSQFTFINALLVGSLMLVVLGIVVHVWMLKRQSRY